MGMAGADPFAIMKALGHSDLQMTMHYVSLGKSHIREQVEKLNTIQLPPPKYVSLILGMSAKNKKGKPASIRIPFEYFDGAKAWDSNPHGIPHHPLKQPRSYNSL